MKLILQFALILYTSVINIAVYDNQENILDVIEYFQNAKPDSTKTKLHRNNLIFQGSTENKDVAELNSYQDVMLNSVKKSIDHKNTPNNQMKYLSRPHDLNLDIVATPTPIKEVWNEVFPSQVLQQTIIKQYSNRHPLYLKNTFKKNMLDQSNEIDFKINPQYRLINNHSPAVKQGYDNDEDVINTKTKFNNIFGEKELKEEVENIKMINRVKKPDKKRKPFKIENRRRAASDDSKTGSSSSSGEIQQWKKQYKETYAKKRKEAMQADKPGGDEVFMTAARPWGIPCGDPNQHKLPWGSCTLMAECPPEYRIFRGDNFCGRSEFACCAIQLNSGDMFQGFDISFDSKSMSTDSEEKKNKDQGKMQKIKKAHARKKRRAIKKMRIKKIKSNIKKIVKEIKKILDKQYKNGTLQRRRKTILLKKFIEKLKKQYKKDKLSVLDIHEEEMIKIDAALHKKLNEIVEVNRNFIKNETFRDIVVNGTMNKKSARMLLEAYPDLEPYVHNALRNPRKIRRSGGMSADHLDENLEYDLEYGYLYFE